MIYSQNSNIRQIKYAFNSTIEALTDLKLLPSAVKVEVISDKITSASTSGIYKQSQLVDGNVKEIVTAGATNALTSTSGVADLVINANAIIPTANSTFATAQGGITITDTKLPELKNAVISLVFDGKDASQLALPKLLYTTTASTKGVLKVGLPTFKGFATPTAFAGVVLQNVGENFKNLPCHITYATKTGTSVILYGNLPASEAVGSTIVIPPSSSDIFARKQTQPKSFEIIASDASTGTITISDPDNLLKSIAFNATTNNLLQAEIVNQIGFSTYNFASSDYWSVSAPVVDLSSFSPSRGDSFTILEYQATN